MGGVHKTTNVIGNYVFPSIRTENINNTGYVSGGTDTDVKDAVDSFSQVNISGDLTFNSSVIVDSPTRIVIEKEATITLADGVDDDVFKVQSNDVIFEIYGTIDGNKANNTAGSAVYCDGYDNVRVYGMGKSGLLKNMPSGANKGDVHYANCNYVSVCDIRSDGSNNDGVHVRGSTFVECLRNKIDNAGGHAIIMGYGSDWVWCWNNEAIDPVKRDCSYRVRSRQNHQQPISL